MNLVVTMAGKSQRFKQQGILFPKWQMIVDHQPMLFWSIKPFVESIKRFGSKIVFVTLKEDNAFKSIELVCQQLDFQSYEIIQLPDSPRGQALSALEAVSCLNKSQRIAIWNVDTLVRVETFDFPEYENWMTLCRFEGEYWSFARIEGEVITEVSEKKRISNWTSIGLYGFASGYVYENLVVEMIRENQASKEEFFVAPLYNRLIARGKIVRPNYMKNDLVSVVGTPEQVFSLYEESRHVFDASTIAILKNNRKSGA